MKSVECCNLLGLVDVSILDELIWHACSPSLKDFIAADVIILSKLTWIGIVHNALAGHFDKIHQCLFMILNLLDKLCVTTFWLHQMARSAAILMSMDLLLACYLANATCAIMNVMHTPIFIIVSQSHAFFPVCVVRSPPHVFVAVAVNPCFLT